MKFILTVFVLFSGILILGCSTIKVHSDYDTAFDFSELSSYSWFQTPAVDPSVDTFTVNRVKTAVNQEMKKKGFNLTTGPSDITVSLQGYKDTVRQASQNRNTSLSSKQYTTNEQFQQGAFTLSIINNKTDRLIWEGHARGIATPNLSTEDRIKKVNEAVAEMLNNFPPK